MRRPSATKKYQVVFGLWMIVLMALLVVILAAYRSRSAGASNQVSITLSDFKIQASQTTFLVGTTYHFVITNDGDIQHEFLVMPPTMAGQTSRDQMDRMALYHIDARQLPAGASKSFDVTFALAATTEPLELACHMPGHYGGASPWLTGRFLVARQ